ncbi:DddA-like double-stranded DNA deaminase toxin [Saccharopolyspora sp. CA-218241]|uniref:DddA-like double-stranded DNA deaminase toxin n=1 Tax=Saccharopolyspora sp. CA-218241 TaxID=3240027 RepID=UPI003D99BEE7
MSSPFRWTPGAEQRHATTDRQRRHDEEVETLCGANVVVVDTTEAWWWPTCEPCNVEAHRIAAYRCHVPGRSRSGGGRRVRDERETGATAGEHAGGGPLEDLARRIRDVEDMLNRAREALLAAQDRHAECEQSLWLLDGTHDPDALDALQGYAAGGAEMLRAWQMLTPIIDAVANYRARLEVTGAVERTPPSASHPSTTGRFPTDAAHDRSWIDTIRERLPQRKQGQTSGIVHDRDGNEHLIIIGREEISDQARLILHNADRFPTDDRGEPTVTMHVEVKYALMMRRSGQTCGVVVINNELCRGCEKAVPEILPEDSTLVVWHPGTPEQMTLRGRARP